MKYSCPKCQSSELCVKVSAVIPLTQENGTQTIDADDAELHWDEDSTMICSECSHSDYTHAFE